VFPSGRKCRRGFFVLKKAAAGSSAKALPATVCNTLLSFDDSAVGLEGGSEMKRLWRCAKTITLMAMVAMMTGFWAVGTTMAAEESIPAAKESTTPKIKENTQNLEDVVVTATRTERALETLPVSASVISANDVKQSAAYRVDDVLRELPGVYVRSYQGIHSSSTTNDVGIGGSNRVVVQRALG
jgi:outer membrane receptor for monomeric catechols